MTDEQRIKVNVIIDKLYDKTIQGLCDWNRTSASLDSYVLKFDVGARIRLYETGQNIILEVYNDNGVRIVTLEYKTILKNATVIKLFTHVKTYHDERTAKILDKILKDLDDIIKSDKPEFDMNGNVVGAKTYDKPTILGKKRKWWIFPGFR